MIGSENERNKKHAADITVDEQSIESPPSLISDVPATLEHLETANK
jgi:hypothetical protein